MDTAELIKSIKIALFGSEAGTARDAMLTQYVEMCREYMKRAGVRESVLNSEAAVGAYVVGVSDLWNYQAGGVKFSPVFRELVMQLKKKRESEEGGV